MSERSEHIEPSVLQAYLEEVLGDPLREGVEAHLEGCARCSVELEGWRMLFRDLEALPAVDPSPRLRDRVLADLPRPAPAREPLWNRILKGIPVGSGPPRSGHPAPRRLQEMLDGTLRGMAKARVEGHLAACDRCEVEVRAWRGLFRTLDGLPHLEPPPAMAHAVMRELAARSPRKVPAPTPAWTERAWGMVDRMLPGTGAGWALVAAIVAVPAIGFLALLGVLLVHPLLGVGELMAFLGWQTGELLRGAWAWSLQRASQSAAVGSGAAAMQSIWASPRLAFSLLAVAWLSTLTASWILYRHAVAPFFIANRHVRTLP